MHRPSPDFPQWGITDVARGSSPEKCAWQSSGWYDEPGLRCFNGSSRRFPEPAGQSCGSNLRLCDGTTLRRHRPTEEAPRGVYTACIANPHHREISGAVRRSFGLPAPEICRFRAQALLPRLSQNHRRRRELGLGPHHSSGLQPVLLAPTRRGPDRPRRPVLGRQTHPLSTLRHRRQTHPPRQPHAPALPKNTPESGLVAAVLAHIKDLLQR